MFAGNFTLIPFLYWYRSSVHDILTNFSIHWFFLPFFCIVTWLTPFSWMNERANAVRFFSTRTISRLSRLSRPWLSHFWIDWGDQQSLSTLLCIFFVSVPGASCEEQLKLLTWPILRLLYFLREFPWRELRRTTSFRLADFATAIFSSWVPQRRPFHSTRPDWI